MPSDYLCKYKYALGVPGEGAHSVRFAGLAAVDLFGTLLIAALIAWKTGHRFGDVTVAMTLLVVFIHFLFCVPTALNVAMGLA